ncbi:MAG: class I SAM-dependent methyltransferase [Caldimonas sp.]|uniref:class I SAM-dependent methyltransferase n=1 Tax=Caldimonas sp. TaxID=2838790 RepID=UPI003918AE59
MQTNEPVSVAGALSERLREAIAADGGWWSFDRFMAAALYTPGLGYYANDRRKFGLLPGSGSDFVTAPELTPLFGQALARQLRQALVASGTAEVWEFGAGSGALASQILGALGPAVSAYHIVDLSGVLRERQRERLAAEQPAHLARVHWHDRLPEAMRGVVIGNEVLDAMPVQLLHFDGQQWLERGVGMDGARFVWRDRPTDLRPPVQAAFAPGTVTEIHPQAEAFVRTLAAHLTRGVVFLIDYGFPEDEYYLPQRRGGTLMCHRAHRADPDPLVDVGEKDITAHVNFTGIALAGQDAGLDVLGYTSQGHFLLNCGLLELMPEGDPRAAAAVQKLVNEHEMGELFKVIGLARGFDLRHFEPIGFAHGDRSHRL